MDEALHALLSGTSAITAIVGSKIFWGMAQQGAAPPALVLNIIGGKDDPHLEGTDGLWRYRVQIDCYGTNRPQARLLSRAVSNALNGHSGTNIRSAFIDTTRENFESAATDRPSRISMDFIINWRG